MRVLVLGAGVIGVTSAWYLAKAGHEVIVIDRQKGPALETSFANAGEISFGYCSPWAAPGIPLKALKWLTMRHAPLILRPKTDLAMASWLLRMLRNCTTARYALNKGRMLRLANYSRACLADLRGEVSLAYDGRMQGTLQLFRTQAQLDACDKDVRALQADDVPFELLDREGCVRAEPALATVSDTITGGLRTPQDETGDCFAFTNELALAAVQAGVAFRFETKIAHISVERGRATGVQTDHGWLRADAVLVALGSHSTRLLRPLKVRLPVYPVKGYSLTLPILDPERAPHSTVMDESYKVAITRLGNRIRVGGLAEISGFSNDCVEARRRTLAHSVSSLFPGGDLNAAQFWCGLRPMTPDGPPVIGPTRYRGLFLNTGHGTLGWTLCTGSGRLIADIISGKATDIDAQDLSLARYA